MLSTVARSMIGIKNISKAEIKAFGTVRVYESLYFLENFVVSKFNVPLCIKIVF